MEATRTPHRRRNIILLLVTIALLNVPAIAVATHVFTDVADGSTHAPGIHYLADTGITGGCSATQFCPDRELTRAQMGSFLFRASGNDPATEPSVNAATVTAGAVQTVTNVKSVVNTSQTAVTVVCPASTVVVGGGGLSSRSDWFMTNSRPSGENSWTVYFSNVTLDGQDQTTTAYARCLTVGQ